jgi:hypothetical protein
MHVLVLRCERAKDKDGDDNDRVQMQLRHHVRTCLRLIVDMGTMWNNTQPTPTHVAKARLASLARIFGTYPMVAVVDLVAFRLEELLPDASEPAKGDESQEAETDMELLRAVVHLLRCLQHADRTTTYLHRLEMEWTVNALDAAR